jgi:shikimate kinase
MKKGIALVGYMGSGKSTWAKLLGENFNIPVIDLDSYLEEMQLEMSISAYIERFGELAFRKKERVALHELAHEQQEIVLATGGGTPCYYDNMDVLNQYFITIYLQSSIPELFGRLKNDKANRPLISHLKEEELKEFIAKHLFERRLFYTKAHVHVDVTGLTKEELINKIEVYRNGQVE